MGGREETGTQVSVATTKHARPYFAWEVEEIDIPATRALG